MIVIGQLLDPLAATIALRAVGRHLDEQVLAGATVAELDETLTVMRDIHWTRRLPPSSVADRALLFLGLQSARHLITTEDRHDSSTASAGSTRLCEVRRPAPRRRSPALDVAAP